MSRRTSKKDKDGKIKRKRKRGLATLLERVNCLNFKVIFQRNVLFKLLVKICVEVGESGLINPLGRTWYQTP